MKLECAFADCCLPDYWSGHHLPHVQIPVYPGMSLLDIKKSIKEELKQGYILGNTRNAFLLSSDFISPEDEKDADRITRAAYAAINKMKPAVKYKKKFFVDLDYQEDEESQVYAFFVFVEI